MKIAKNCEGHYGEDRMLKRTKFRSDEVLSCFKSSIDLYCLDSVALIIGMTLKSSLQHGFWVIDALSY